MKRILVVDDSPTVRQQVEAALTPAGYLVVTAEDGIIGLDVLRQGSFALVICDVNMPRMSGLDLVEQLRREPQHAETPVVMLTTEGQPALVARAKKAGVRSWIIKPFKADLLLAAVNKFTG